MAIAKKLASNVALLAVTFVLCFGAVEVGLRAYYKMQQRYSADAAQSKLHGWIRERSEDAYDRPGEYYGLHDEFALMRYSTYLGYFPTRSHEGKGYRTNNLGFRNDEDLAKAKADGELRVFVLGGSTAWGAGVRQEDTYASFLQAMLRDSLDNPAVTVWNAGVGAYLSAHERILAINLIRRLDPDVIVHLTGWNDPYAGYRGYSVNDDSWDYLGSAAILGTYHRRFVFDAQMARMVDPGPPRRDQHSLATAFLVDQIYYARRLDAERRPPRAVVDDFIDNMRLSKAAAGDGVKVVVALQPSLYATQKTLTEWEQAVMQKNMSATPDYAAYNAAVYELYRRQLKDALPAAGIEYVDMDPAVADEPRSVFADHVHLGDRGNRALAQRLSETLTPLMKVPSTP